jgi:hypothetical protein
MRIIKICEACGLVFTVPPSQNRVRACSSPCGYKIRRISTENLSRAGRKGGLKLKGRKFPGRWNTGCFRKGNKLSFGRKRLDMAGKNNIWFRLTEGQRELKAENHSRVLSGRKNPEHSDFLKRFFFEHPEKHVNVIMAREQKFGVGYISKGQIELYEKIKETYPTAELNFPIKTSSGNLYFADIAIPHLKTIIEYDGDYWHKDEEKDTIRTFNLQKDGWKVVRVKENEYRNATKLSHLRNQDVTCGEAIVKITGLNTT